MTELKPRCARCGHTMERGVILDRADGGKPLTQDWIEGAPEKSWFGLKTKGRERHSVITFRCGGCGHLDSYAPASPDSPG